MATCSSPETGASSSCAALLPINLKPCKFLTIFSGNRSFIASTLSSKLRPWIFLSAHTPSIRRLRPTAQRTFWSELYAEVISAHISELNVLWAVGLRGLIEGVCADKKIQGRNLDERVEAMKLLLPENIVKNLHGFRFMGNRAAHELEAPVSGELQVAIDLIEDILNYFYDLDYKARLFGGLNAAQKGNP